MRRPRWPRRSESGRPAPRRSTAGSSDALPKADRAHKPRSARQGPVPYPGRDGARGPAPRSLGLARLPPARPGRDRVRDRGPSRGPAPGRLTAEGTRRGAADHVPSPWCVLRVRRQAGPDRRPGLCWSWRKGLGRTRSPRRRAGAASPWCWPTAIRPASSRVFGTHQGLGACATLKVRPRCWVGWPRSKFTPAACSSRPWSNPGTRPSRGARRRHGAGPD